VKARTSGKSVAAPAKVLPTKVSAAQAKFPMGTENQGVALQIQSVQQQGDSLVISVTLKNMNSDPVKFLYTFLEIKDEEGRSLSANTEGLPSELPPDSEPYSGTIRVPLVAADKVEKLSLALADYPDQQIQLEVKNIPVIR
jgi:hypothetical protein